MNVLKVIIYFSIFKYPLTKTEIFSFSAAKNMVDVEFELKKLVENSIIFKHGDYYSDVDDKTLVTRRLKGNNMANAIMTKALKRAKLIMSFPFIEAVAISGSLSKGYYDNDGDIDFFIITKPKRLWLARTLLVAYKKLVLLNSKKHFCVNYFISSNRLTIAEQNTFTATELLTLIPIYGKSTFNRFLANNMWASDIYPNKEVNTSFLTEEVKKPLWSKTLTVLLNNGFGKRIDRILKRLTLKKWHTKFKHLNKSDFEVAMKSTNDVSKHHPQNFQDKVITALNERYNKTNKAFNLNLALENA